MTMGPAFLTASENKNILIFVVRYKDDVVGGQPGILRLVAFLQQAIDVDGYGLTVAG